MAPEIGFKLNSGVTDTEKRVKSAFTQGSKHGKEQIYGKDKNGCVFSAGNN